MIPKIQTVLQKKLVGKRLNMSLANDNTRALWSSFMPARKGITNAVPSNLISMQVYDADYFTSFKPTATFEKWAAIEVTDFDNLPDGMEAFLLPGGLYAVFHYKGSSTDNNIYQYIFGTWLPQSGYVLDNRPHFELLGEKYKNADADSEEDIYVPIKEVDITSLQQ